MQVSGIHRKLMKTKTNLDENSLLGIKEITSPVDIDDKVGYGIHSRRDGVHLDDVKPYGVL